MELIGKSLSEIAMIIAKDHKAQGKAVNYAAKPYVDAMTCLNSVNDNYGLDDGRSIVSYALCNLTGWKGETARAVKSHLKKLVK